MIGQTISHYKILEEIGRGGMGVVYKAEDFKLKRTVALKFLPPELTRDAEAKKRFIQEAQAASGLDHPNICTIHEIGETEDGQLFIVMAFYEGETLRQRLAKFQGKGMPENEALDLALQIAEGLQAAHQRGIVHRDIKPANIMITRDGRVKILDFGLAKLVGEARVTREISTLGTAAYMSPEQCRGEEVDGRTDIWSFGVVLYEMLTGHLPFRGEYEQAVIYSILNEEPPSVRALRPVLSSGWEQILNRCLAKDPVQRYPNTEKLAADLERQKSTLGAASFPETMSGNARRQPHWTKPAAAAGFLLLVLFLGLLGYLHFGKKGEQARQPIPIAVVDFRNETNEQELDGLSGMLITALEQSRRLHVLTRSRLFAILRQIGKENVERIDETLGLEICQKANIRTMAAASIRKFGKIYSIDLKVLDVPKNEYLFTLNVHGKGQESIPSLIDQLSEKTREALRERRADILAASRRVEEVTTTNLEAYQHFFRGEEMIDKLQFKEAIQEFSKAITLDSTFGLAYYRLAYATSWQIDVEEPSVRFIRKAMALIDRIPARQQFLVRAVYAQITQGFEAGLAVLKEMEKIYPDDREMIYNIGDWSFHAAHYKQAETYLLRTLADDSSNIRALQHLTWTYENMRRYREMLRVAWRYVAQSPRFEAYNLVAQAYDLLGKSDEGLRILQQELTKFPGRYAIREAMANLYMFSDRYDEAEKILSPLLLKEQSVHVRLSAYEHLADVYMYQGRYRQVLGIRDKEIDLLALQKDTLGMVSARLAKALHIAFRGHNEERAWQEAEKTFRFGEKVKRGVYPGQLSLLLVYRGDYERALELSKGYHIIQWQELLKFLSLADSGDDAKAILKGRHLLQSITIASFRILLLYNLARVSFRTGDLDSAASYLRQIHGLKSNAYSFRPVWYPLTYYWLARIYEKKGQPQLARQNYERFLALWRDADPDLPELVDAKNRLAQMM